MSVDNTLSRFVDLWVFDLSPYIIKARHFDSRVKKLNFYNKIKNLEKELNQNTEIPEN